MSDTNTDPAQNNGTNVGQNPTNTPPAPQNNQNDIPDWARKQITDANTEAASYRVKARDLGTENETLKAQVQTLTGEKTTALDQLGGAQLELVKLQTALSVGVPGEQATDFAELLKGDTAEEIKASAERAKTLLGTGRRPAATDPSQGQGAPTPNTPADEFHGFVLGQLSH